MNLPFSYTDINLIAGRVKPSTQKPYNNATYAYWARALFERASYAIDITLPEKWENHLKGLFYYWLYSRGFLGIFRNDEMGMGVVFQIGTLRGRDYYYQPREFLVTNPYDTKNNSRVLEIGKDCAIIKISPDFMGIWDVIDFYARKLSDLSMSVDMSIINTRLAKIMFGRNKAAAESLKKVLDKINSGEPAVIIDDKLLDDRTDKASPFQEFGIEHLKENYITNLQWDDLRKILSDFESEIGIPTYDKKERLVSYEAEMKTVECVPRVTVWVETLNSCFKTANELFGLDMSAKVREREYNDGIGNTNYSGIVQLAE